MSLNRWELEEDNDSDFSGEYSSNRPLSNSRGRGNQRLDRDRERPQSKSSKAESRRSNASSASRGLYSDDDDDLDEEELPEGSTSKSAEWVGSSSRVNNGNNVENAVVSAKKATYSLKPVTASKSHPSDDEITFEELREAFSETEAKGPSGRQGSEVEVDKIELARAIRYIGVPALADDILNLSTRKVSWVTLTAVAKPYTGNSRQGPVKPVRAENATIQNSSNSFGPNAGPSNLSRHDLTDTKAKRLSVAFVALDSDEEEEQLRAKHGSRSPTSHEASSIPASTAPSSSSSNWSSQTRQQSRDVKITKSMEQESWHDNDRSQDLTLRNQRNVGQSSDSAESPLRGSRVEKNDGNNSRLSSPDRYSNPSEGTGSRSHNDQRSPAEAQRRWDSKDDDDGDSDEDGYDSRSDEGKGEEEDGFEEQRMISPIRPDTDNHGNRLDRKVPYDPLDISPKRVMTSSPVLDGPGPGLRSPPLPPKPTRLSHSPNTVKLSRPVEQSSYLNASNDSSFFSGPHPLASSWETAISQSYEGVQSGDSPKTTGLPPKKPPRPHTMAQSLEPRGRPNLVSPGGKAMSVSHNGKNTQVKRSISWSAAVSSSHMKPPRPKSTGSLMASSYASSSMDSEGGLSADHDYDAYVALPPLSEYAERTGVIIEGWLEKKSARTGFWQKRFFVLSESSEEFCVMRIYYKTVECSWGLVPLRKKATIPIGSVKGVSSVSSKIKQGKQFSLTFTSTEKEKISHPRSRKGSDATHASKGAHDQGDMSEWGDSDGEGEGDGMIKSMILKADDLKTRMLWTAMLEKVLHLYNDEGMQ